MAKKILKIVGVLVALVIIALVVVSFTLGSIVEKGINVAGPKALGVPVSVENVKLNPFSGNAAVENMVIGNPEEFKTDSLFKLGNFNAGVNVMSLLSDTVKVRNIEIRQPVITYEMTMKGSNMGAVTGKLKKKASAGKAKEEEKAGKKPPQKKIMIDHVVMQDAEVRVLAPGLAKPLTVKLPKLELTDIGTESGGVRMDRAWLEIMLAVGEAVAEEVAQSGEISDLGRNISSQLEQAGDNLSKDIEKLGSSLTNEAEKLGIDPDKALNEVNKLLR